MGFTIASALAMTGSLLFISSGACQNSAADELKGKVREAVLEAKASDRSQIQILAPLITPTFVDSLYTVGEQYTVIVGQPLQIVTALTGRRLHSHLVQIQGERGANEATTCSHGAFRRILVAGRTPPARC